MSASLAAQLVQNSVQKTRVQSLGWEDPLEKGKPTHSRTLAWRILWTVHGVAKSRTQLSNSFFLSGDVMSVKPSSHFTRDRSCLTV